MLPGTGGSSNKAIAFSGMSIRVAEKRENYDLAWGRELGGEGSGAKVFAEAASCLRLTLGLGL